MKPLDLFIRQYVHPGMKAAGFAKKGRSFRREPPAGDVIILEFPTHQVDASATVFEVNFSIAPLVYWKWLRRNEAEPRTPDSGGAVLRCPVMPPVELSYRPNGSNDFLERWAFRDEQSYVGCGAALSGLLIGTAIPKMERLFDRRALLEEFLNPTLPDVRFAGRDLGEVVLSLDIASKEEIQEKLDALRGNDRMKYFVAWAEGYSH